LIGHCIIFRAVFVSSAQTLPEGEFGSRWPRITLGRGQPLWGGSEHPLCCKESRKSDVHQSRQAIPEPDFHIRRFPDGEQITSVCGYRFDQTQVVAEVTEVQIRAARCHARLGGIDRLTPVAAKQLRSEIQRKCGIPMACDKLAS
jgi:hypothetical protein